MPGSPRVGTEGPAKVRAGAASRTGRAAIAGLPALGLQRQLDALIAELERSLSPALARELHHLAGPKPGPGLTADELRVEYETVLSWTIGLVIGILTELEVASAKAARAAGPVPA